MKKHPKEVRNKKFRKTRQKTRRNPWTIIKHTIASENLDPVVRRRWGKLTFFLWSWCCIAPNLSMFTSPRPPLSEFPTIGSKTSKKIPIQKQMDSKHRRPERPLSRTSPSGPCSGWTTRSLSWTATSSSPIPQAEPYPSCKRRRNRHRRPQDRSSTAPLPPWAGRPRIFQIARHLQFPLSFLYISAYDPDTSKIHGLDPGGGRHWWLLG